jgi:HNH endonuclease
MNWENWGKYDGKINTSWDIDHIIPISSAVTEEDILKLNHYTNLQPLCSYVNRYIKKDNL